MLNILNEREKIEIHRHHPRIFEMVTYKIHSPERTNHSAILLPSMLFDTESVEL